jgi:hypothetical protein
MSGQERQARLFADWRLRAQGGENHGAVEEDRGHRLGFQLRRRFVLCGDDS